MKAVVFSELGAADVLRVTDLAVPEPGAGEVRVRVAVSGVNPTDWKGRSGAYGAGEGEIPLSVPNHDGAGVIDAVGPDVGDFAVGDRVWVSLAAYQRPASGTAQEYTILAVNRVFPLPDGASFELGAATGIPALTAHRSLTVAEDGPSRLAPGALEGAVVLVAGGAGAVGHAAVQLARWAGATVVATVSGEAKASYAKAAGAHHVVNYRDDDAAEQIRAIAPEGVDLIVEVAAGRNNALDLAVLKNRGTIAIYANDGGTPFAIDIGQNMGLNVRYQFVLGYTFGWDKVAAGAEDINAAIADGALPVGEVAGLPLLEFGLDRTDDAHRAVESGAVGKVLVKVADL
ncbi:NADPH:quinone reductase [Kribbella italica]|uniref:NADPH2:quinone reductase n=1 Tax=Kribbella italica TaxID=1540520 RepID=A0A7W9MSF5_9ACTN|nr:NADPH:quinone reductase [Kribbella italica]MBB5834676.1 NADPH2:quinone reductase [Kribbella italica]